MTTKLNDSLLGLSLPNAIFYHFEMRRNKRNNKCMCNYKSTHLSYGKPWQCTQWPAVLTEQLHYEATHHGGYYCRPTALGESLLRMVSFPVPAGLKTVA